VMNTNWERVGSIGVDAGLCWVGDPCYCVTPDASSHPAETWDEFCAKLRKGEKEGVMEWASGVSVSTGYGDGEYPVYVKRDSDRRVVEVKVVFVGAEVDDED